MARSRLTCWDSRFPWEVPREMTSKPPDDMTWAATGRRYELGPYSPPAVIKPEDWTGAEAGPICALLLVSSVHARALIKGPPPGISRLFTRRPLTVHLAYGQQLTVNAAESRFGEVWAFPLMRLVGPQAST